MAAVFAALFTAPAFAEGTTTPANAQTLSMICESGRLTDVERRECRALFKSANSETALVAAHRVFRERINGPVR